MSTSTRLATAVLSGAVEEARALLQAGADVKAHAEDYPWEWNLHFDTRPAPLLHLAALAGNVPMVKLLLQYGANIDERPLIEIHYQTHDDSDWASGASALSMAVDRGFLAVADLLLEAGAKLDPGTERALKKATRPKKPRKPKKR
jgi:hypothetical protein